MAALFFGLLSSLKQDVAEMAKICLQPYVGLVLAGNHQQISFNMESPGLSFWRTCDTLESERLPSRV